MKALVADDDITSSRLLTRLLSPYGQVTTVADGVEAIVAFRIAHHDGEPYNLLCLDIMMPDLDGQTVLRKVREFEKASQISEDKKVRIIMTTSVKDRSMVMDAIKAQCDSYLLKPLDKSELQKHLVTLGLVDQT